MEERKEEKERQAFQEDINYFLGKEYFSLHDFHERVLVRIHLLISHLIL